MQLFILLRRLLLFLIRRSRVAVIIVGMTSVATLSAFATELRTAETSRTALEAASLAENYVGLPLE